VLLTLCRVFRCNTNQRLFIQPTSSNATSPSSSRHFRSPTSLIDKVLSASATDDAIPTVITMCTAGWTDDVDAVPPAVRPYWFSRDQLSVQGGLLLHGARVVVPSSLRRETLTALHADGHLGVDKCRAKARASIWWPKIGADIGRFVSSCLTCLHWARDRAEPLLSTPLPDLPWQQVATDLFELDGRHFIVVVDYYSRFFELTQLKSQTSDDVIKAMKNIFARHGIPMLCVSDGGPCYRSAEFQTFASTYGFQHRMSSPRFSQANGAAERAVQTAKSLLRRADDQFLALLAYRTTPIVDGYSPAQLLMGRQLRSTVPTTQQQPATVDARRRRRPPSRQSRQATSGDKLQPSSSRSRREGMEGWRQRLGTGRQHRGNGDRSAAVPFIPTTYGQRLRHPSQRQSAATRASAEDIYNAAGNDASTVLYRYADVQRSVSPSRPSGSTTETPTDSGPVGKSVASRRHPFRTSVQTTGPHEPVKGGM
jgi:hypothetical protein